VVNNHSSSGERHAGGEAKRKEGQRGRAHPTALIGWSGDRRAG
jgi:hypothetical protein